MVPMLGQCVQIASLSKLVLVFSWDDVNIVKNALRSLLNPVLLVFSVLPEEEPEMLLLILLPHASVLLKESPWCDNVTLSELLCCRRQPTSFWSFFSLSLTEWMLVPPSNRH